MQVSNNYQSNTNFTGFKMPQSSHKRFMHALRDECSVSDLIKIRNTMENQALSKTTIYLEDLGYMAGFEVNGHLAGTINGKTSYNSFSTNIARFIQKLGKKADKAELKLKTKTASNLIEECSIANKFKSVRNAQNAATKTECATAKSYRKNGLVSESEQKGYLLGEIYKLVGGKNGIK